MGEVSNNHVFRVGKIRGELVRYKSGVSGCVWIPFPTQHDEHDVDGVDDGSGICFDFSHEDLNDIAQVMIDMKNAIDEQIGVYEENEEDQKYLERVNQQKTFWWRFKWWLRDWGFQFMPFDWEFKLGAKRIYYTMKTPIFAIGPFKFTKGNWTNNE